MWLRGQGQKCNCLVESKEVLDDDEGKEVCVLPLPSGWWVAMTTLSTPSSLHDSLHLVRDLAHPVLDHIIASTYTAMLPASGSVYPMAATFSHLGITHTLMA